MIFLKEKQLRWKSFWEAAQTKQRVSVSRKLCRFCKTFHYYHCILTDRLCHFAAKVVKWTCKINIKKSSWLLHMRSKINWYTSQTQTLTHILEKMSSWVQFIINIQYTWMGCTENFVQENAINLSLWFQSSSAPPSRPPQSPPWRRWNGSPPLCRAPRRGRGCPTRWSSAPTPPRQCRPPRHARGWASRPGSRTLSGARLR